MRRLAVFAVALGLVAVPGAVLADTLECLSIDGQLRVDFLGDAASVAAIRLPADGRREVRVWQLFPSDMALEVLSESPPSRMREGCDGADPGTIAIVKTTTITTRRLRLRLSDGGAFPPDVIGRSPDGDAVERDLTCIRSNSVMATCP